MRKPVIKGCAVELDSWVVCDDGALIYRLAVDLDAIQRERLTSEEIHNLTAFGKAGRHQWYWERVESKEYQVALEALKKLSYDEVKRAVREAGYGGLLAS